MLTITAYRDPEGDLTLNPRSEIPHREVRVYLVPGSRVDRDGGDRLRIYHGRLPFGADVEGALQHGWCSLHRGADATLGEARNRGPANEQAPRSLPIR